MCLLEELRQSPTNILPHRPNSSRVSTFEITKSSNNISRFRRSIGQIPLLDRTIEKPWPDEYAEGGVSAQTSFRALDDSPIDIFGYFVFVIHMFK